MTTPSMAEPGLFYGLCKTAPDFPEPADHEQLSLLDSLRTVDPDIEEINAILADQFAATFPWCPEHPESFLDAMQKMRSGGSMDYAWRCEKHDHHYRFRDTPALLTIFSPPNSLASIGYPGGFYYAIDPIGPGCRGINIMLDYGSMNHRDITKPTLHLSGPSSGHGMVHEGYLGTPDELAQRKHTILLGNGEVAAYVVWFMQRAADLGIPFRPPKSRDEHATAVYGAFFDKPDILYTDPHQFAFLHA